MPAENETQKVEAVLREHAMSYPGAHEDFPWGHRAMKVNDKTFLFMTVDGEKLNLSAKLPDSKDAALTLPFTEPTEYGLGKSGWVTAHFEDASQVPVPVIKAWIDESYRAIAPRKLVDQLPARGTVVPGPAAKPSRAEGKKASVRRAAAPAKKAMSKVKAVAKKAAARVKTAAKKATQKVSKKASAAKAKPARKAAAPARGKRSATSAPKRARRS
ncbi:MmcQ/YjbR family DNA-binding protein [Corallococcus sp. EGB]|uniref:MmcQ/YjbR family DNA-binding protein n=1 Tax=Corallococcus sp. EGB TaxID=1521117 RepID=UPI001CBD2113|nr:MmcQ/YjbR family DNA-binding protein [Corallococcus sp. EGB]